MTALYAACLHYTALKCERQYLLTFPVSRYFLFTAAHLHVTIMCKRSAAWLTPRPASQSQRGVLCITMAMTSPPTAAPSLYQGSRCQTAASVFKTFCSEKSHSVPATTRRRPTAISALGQRLRRWPNVETAFGRRLVIVFSSVSWLCFLMN